MIVCRYAFLISRAVPRATEKWNVCPESKRTLFTCEGWLVVDCEGVNLTTPMLVSIREVEHVCESLLVQRKTNVSLKLFGHHVAQAWQRQSPSCLICSSRD